MSFLHPTLLAVGLASIAIPLIIHFFLRKRRKPVRWAAMRFLLEAYRKHRRRRKLEQIILLALRCLLIAALAIGIARPILGGLGDSRAATLVVVVDNGLVSGLAEDGGTVLDRHLEQAAELIRARDAGRGDRVAVVAAAAPPESVVASPTLDHESALRALERIETRSSRSDLSGALSLAASLLGDEGEIADADHRIVILSDWRAGSLGSPGPPASGSDGAPLERASLSASKPAERGAPNLRVASVTPGRGALFPSDAAAARQTLVTVERDGDALPELTVTAEAELLDGPGATGPRAAAPVTLGEGERSAVVALPIPIAAAERAEAAIRVRLVSDAASDGVPGDSVGLRSLRLRDSARVGIAHARRSARSVGAFGSADWLRAALNPDDGTPIRVVELSAPGLRADDLAGLDAVFVTDPDLVPDAGWGDLARFAARGGTVVLVPPADEGAQRWPDRLADLAGFEGTFGREPVALGSREALSVGRGAARGLPMLAGELSALASDATVAVLLESGDVGESAVLETESGRPVLIRLGERVWVFAASLTPSWTDLPTKPIFVPLVQEIARSSAEPGAATTARAGTSVRVPDGAVELVGADGARISTVGAASAVAPADAGVWSARNARGEAGTLLAVTPDPEGGRTDPTSADDVLDWLDRAAPGVRTAWLGEDAGSDGAERAGPDDARDWIPFVVAVVLATAELLVARFASHAGRMAGRPASRSEDA
jgi:hypothetical protein